MSHCVYLSRVSQTSQKTAQESYAISSYNFVASNATTFLPGSLKMGSKVERRDKTVYFLSFRKKAFQHCTLTTSGYTWCSQPLAQQLRMNNRSYLPVAGDVVNYINACSSYRYLQIQVFQPVYTFHITHEQTVAVTIWVHFTPAADTIQVTSQEIS
jgi:hypothetical protein